MTDHAAEAQRILAHLNAGVARMNAECADNILPAEGAMAPDVTASALLAIAHTLQAIHTLMDANTRETANPNRCAALATSHPNTQCIRPMGHTGGHETPRGHHWT